MQICKKKMYVSENSVKKKESEREEKWKKGFFNAFYLRFFWMFNKFLYNSFFFVRPCSRCCWKSECSVLATCVCTLLLLYISHNNIYNILRNNFYHFYKFHNTLLLLCFFFFEFYLYLYSLISNSNVFHVPFKQVMVCFRIRDVKF